MYKIVNTYKNGMDEENFGYAVCSCFPSGVGIEIPRPEKTGYIVLRCPNCGDFIGIVLKGKNTQKNLDIL